MNRQITMFALTIAIYNFFSCPAHSQEAQLSLADLCQMEDTALKSEKQLLSAIAAEQAANFNPLRQQLLLKQLEELKSTNWNTRISFFEAKPRLVSQRYLITESKENFTAPAKIVVFGAENNGFGIWATLPCPQADPIVGISVAISDNYKPPANMIVGPPYTSLAGLADNLQRISKGDVVDLDGEIYFTLLKDTARDTASTSFSPQISLRDNKTWVIYNATIRQSDRNKRTSVRR